MNTYHPNHPAPTVAYILIADGVFDQVCETADTAKQERNWLKSVGCIVRVIKCPWLDQNDVIDQYS